MRPAYELDIENLHDFFEIKLKHLDSNTVFSFPLWPGSPPLDLQRLAYILSKVTIYTFNGNNYDLPILVLALYGADLELMKPAGDMIIQRGMKSWDFYRYYGIEPPDYIDHVDLMEVAAGVRISLKMYGARMHAPTIQDLPVAHDEPLPAGMRCVVSAYCDNDLDTTGLLRVGVADRLALREAIGIRYGIDVRSKSDAQIAEAVIRAQLPFKPDRRYIPHGFTFNYTPPPYIRFVSPELNALLDAARNASFFVSDKEEAMLLGLEDGAKTGVQIPKELKGRDIRIGQAVYRIGIGGLHSQEKCQAFKAVPGVRVIRDVDVKSYYPSLILSMGMYPQQLGPDFLSIYREVYDRRLSAKSEAERMRSVGEGLGGPDGAEILLEAKSQQTESDGLKIVLNGTFGKLFSKYSILYAPEFGIATTMTGQLALLMLIEALEMAGVRVISANTDGIVLFYDPKLQWIVDETIAWWERQTSLEMEATDYSAIYSRDVNNYVAITTKGKVKRKGFLRESGLLENKHPDKDICAEAVVAYVSKGTPVSETIIACEDIRKFVAVRNVKGGGYFIPHVGEKQFLGRAVRWYYSTNSTGKIVDAKSGNKVAGTEGCVPAMTLPTQFPKDIDYQHYVEVAIDMLKEIGAL